MNQVFSPSKILIWIGKALVICVLSVGAYLYQHSLDVQAQHNHPLVALPYAMKHESLDHPVLKTLRESEKLDDLISFPGSRFEKLKRLRNWVYKQGVKGQPQEGLSWNACELLQKIRQGESQGYCAQYAQIFAQACLSLGWQVRYIEIGTKTSPAIHYTTEVWNDESAQWVVMDPYRNLHYQSQGLPLSALEIHQALVAGKNESIKVYYGSDAEAWPDDQASEVIAEYYYLRIHSKMDHLSDPEKPFERSDMVEWEDDQTIPWEKSEVPHSNPHIRGKSLAAMAVFSEEVFNAPLNRVHAKLIPNRLFGQVSLELSNNMPDFSVYQYRIDDGAWQILKSSELKIDLDRGQKKIELLPLNLRGVKGVSTELLLSWSTLLF